MVRFPMWSWGDDGDGDHGGDGDDDGDDDEDDDDVFYSSMLPQPRPYLPWDSAWLEMGGPAISSISLIGTGPGL